MASSGSGRFLRAERSRAWIYISQRVVQDSAFPFKAGDELVVTIEGKKLVVEKAEKKRT